MRLNRAVISGIGLLTVAFIIIGGCATGTAATANSSSSATGQAGLDPLRMKLSLEEIEPRPVMPANGDYVSADSAAPTVRRMFTRGVEKYRSRLWSESIEALEKAIEEEPRLAEARVILAKAALRQGNRQVARRQIEEAVRLHPDDVSGQRLLGEIEWQGNDAAKAVAALRLAVGASNAKPDHPDVILARLTLAMALRKEGYVRAAASQLGQYLDAVPPGKGPVGGDEELRETQTLYRGTAAAMLGDWQAELGDHAAAIAAYQRATSESPDDVKLQQKLAAELAAGGRGEEAIELVRRTLPTMASKSEGLALLKRICDGMNDSARFEVEVARLASETDDPALLLQLTGTLIEQGHLAEAISELEKLLRKHPDQADARYRLAGLYLQEGAVDKFVVELGRAIQSDRGSDKRAEPLIARACETAAKAFLDAAGGRSKAVPGDVSLHYLLARAEQCAGQKEAAAAEFREAARLDPSFEPAAIGLVAMLLEDKAWEKAAAAAENAVDHDVQSVAIYRLKARAHDALDQLDEAEASLTEAYRLDPKSIDALLAIGELAKRRRNIQQYEQVYTKILESVDEKCIPAREALIRLYLEANQLAKARELYRGFARLGLQDAAVERCEAAIALEAQKLDEDGYRARLKAIALEAPRDAETWLELSRSAGRSRDFNACLRYADEALKIDPENIEARDIKVVVLKRLLRFEEAQGVMSDLLIERPRNVLWRQQQVELALDRGDFDGAIEMLRELVKRDDLGPLAAVFTDELVQQLSAAKRWDEAEKTASEWLEASPDDVYRRAVYLRVLSAAGRHERAVELADEWLKADSSNPMLREQVLTTLNAARRYAQSQMRLLGWLEDAPDDVALNRAMISVLWLAGDWNGAADVARLGMSSSPRKSDKWKDYRRWLGRTLILSGRYDEAISHYQTAVQEDGGEDDYQSLVLVLIAAERYKEAEEVIERVLGPLREQSAENNATAREIIADFKGYLVSIYERTGRRERAIQYLEEIHHMNPNDPGNCNNLGYTMLEGRRDIRRAEKLIRTALGADPRNDAYLDSLGWAYYLRSDFKNAIRYLQLALRQGGREDPVMLDHLGDAHYRAGEIDKAQEAWKRARTALKELAKEPQPLDVERRTLLEDVRRKLKQAGRKQAVDVAPVGELRAASRPAA